MGPLHIVFLHMDLGIGGAEQLVINLALASLEDDDTKHRVSIFTTHCSQSHCFDAVRKHPINPGILADKVHLIGTFIPVDILGFGRTFCSTLRMLYLSVAARWMYPDADVFVLDVLPTSIPYLVLGNGGVNSVIFYCHFPDKLLKRDMINGQLLAGGTKKNVSSKEKITGILKELYRLVMNKLEEWSMSYADLICVNSRFTKKETLRVFPSIHQYTIDGRDNMKVLYPAIDLNKFIPPNFQKKKQLLRSGKLPIVSLNRFERKKNIEVLLYSYAILKERSNETSISLPPLVIAGGYDPNNSENVEYLIELQFLAEKLNIKKNTTFRPSVSEMERATLLQSALCLVYSPFREHFGIVPIEAMFAGSAVIAVKSGGPMETCVDDETGILVDVENLKENLAVAMLKLVTMPDKAIEMGMKGHEHVKTRFGLESFKKQWMDIVIKYAIPLGCERKNMALKKRNKFILCYFSIFVIWQLTIVLTNDWNTSTLMKPF